MANYRQLYIYCISAGMCTKGRKAGDKNYCKQCEKHKPKPRLRHINGITILEPARR